MGLIRSFICRAGSATTPTMCVGQRSNMNRFRRTLRITTRQFPVKFRFCPKPKAGKLAYGPQPSASCKAPLNFGICIAIPSCCRTAIREPQVPHFRQATATAWKLETITHPWNTWFLTPTLRTPALFLPWTTQAILTFYHTTSMWKPTALRQKLELLWAHSDRGWYLPAKSVRQGSA